MSTRAIETPPRGVDASRDDGRSSPIQWSAIVAGSLAGFAVTVLMATLGAALGVSVGAAMVDEPMSRHEAGKTALGFGVGSAIWALLTAAVVGCVGGTVLNRTARRDRPYLPMAFGTLTWVGGVLLALIVAAPGAAGLLGGVTSGAGAAAGGAASAMAENPAGAFKASSADPSRAQQQPPQRPMTEQEEREIRERASQASQAAAALAWVVLGTQLVSLAATMLAARFKRERSFPLAMGAPQPH